MDDSSHASAFYRHSTVVGIETVGASKILLCNSYRQTIEYSRETNNGNYPSEILRRDRMPLNERNPDFMECGWVKSPSGRGAEVKWNPQDKCVYWNGHYIGKAKTAEEAVAKTRTWIMQHHIR